MPRKGGGDKSSSAGLAMGLNSDFCLRASPRPASICRTLAGGGFASGLVRRGAIVTGLDTDAAPISAARRRSAPAPMFRTGRAERLPFAGAFHRVVAVSVVCFALSTPSKRSRE